MNSSKSFRWKAFAFGGLFAGLVAAGCGGGPDLPEMAPVSGQVTLDGTPLAKGTVFFIPDAGTEGPPGVGAIDETGHYEIRTQDRKGAIVGNHRIRVECREEIEDPTTQSWAPSLIPEKYDDPAKSGLSAEVKAGEENEVNLTLTSQ